MEFEALLFGIEPVTALAVGVAAVIITPVISAVGSAIASAIRGSNLGESVSESTKDLAKKSLVCGMDAVDNLQSTYAQRQEAVQDIVVDAKIEHTVKKTGSEVAPQTVKKIAASVTQVCKNIWGRIQKATSAVNRFFGGGKSKMNLA